MNVLIVSNGHGEAAIAGYLGRALMEREPGARIEHFPLVGEGGESPHGVTIVGPRKPMPSGGLVAYWNFKNLLRDVGAGLPFLIARQDAFLSRQRERDVVVAVGDVYCLATSLLFARRPTIFVATAKSEHVAGHSRLECAVARRARIVFARDAETARSLRARGVNARFAGNLMMDGVAAASVALESAINPAALRIAILPGSRDDAPANAFAAIRRARLVTARIAPRAVQALVSLAPGVSLAAIVEAAARAGVALERVAEAGNIADAGYAADARCVAARGTRGSLDVLAIDGCFGELVRACDIVFGQAGTGNEQAAGLGKPVLAWSQGSSPSRLGWYRMRQQRLLGAALLVLPDDDRAFIDGVAALLGDSERMEAMSRAGRERMGDPGGSNAVAEAVLTLASESAG